MKARRKGERHWHLAVFREMMLIEANLGWVKSKQ